MFLRKMTEVQLDLLSLLQASQSMADLQSIGPETAGRLLKKSLVIGIAT